MDKNNDNYPVQLSTEIMWERTGNVDFPYVNEENEDAEMVIRLNDFPDEPLFSLIVANQLVCSFNDWPEPWKIQPE